MGAAKSAMECLCRYFAVTLARRKITVNAISPGWIEDSVLNMLPEAAQNLIRTWHQGGWTPMGRLLDRRTIERSGRHGVTASYGIHTVCRLRLPVVAGYQPGRKRWSKN